MSSPVAQAEQREFELVLGNKQLLSLLFVVVVLLGIFFAMGYVVGKNSAPVQVATGRQEPYNRTDSRSALGPQATPTPEPVTIEGASGSTTPHAGTASPTPAAEPERPKPIEVAPVTVAQPQVGETYLQVSAVARPEAELLSELLNKKGFRSIVALGPDASLFRVLVGPARDAGELGRLKTELEKAGFKSMVRKY